jgi:hypothetical protein
MTSAERSSGEEGCQHISSSAYYSHNEILFYAIILLSALNLILPHLKLAYRSANLSIPEILGYNNRNVIKAD